MGCGASKDTGAAAPAAAPNKPTPGGPAPARAPAPAPADPPAAAAAPKSTPAPESDGKFKLPEIESSFDAWLQAQLDASPADGKDTDEFKYITFTEVPPFTDKHKSLMRKTMTPELFAKLKDVKSSKGYTLSNGMQAGVLRPHLGVGFTCGDEECFELFKDVINPIVQGWHNFDPATQTHTSDLDFSGVQHAADATVSHLRTDDLWQALDCSHGLLTHGRVVRRSRAMVQMVHRQWWVDADLTRRQRLFAALWRGCRG